MNGIGPALTLPVVETGSKLTAPSPAPYIADRLHARITRSWLIGLVDEPERVTALCFCHQNHKHAFPKQPSPHTARTCAIMRSWLMSLTHGLSPDCSCHCKQSQNHTSPPPLPPRLHPPPCTQTAVPVPSCAAG